MDSPGINWERSEAPANALSFLASMPALVEDMLVSVSLSPTNGKSSFPRSHESAIVLKIEKSSLLVDAPGTR